jgi:enterochelin esterase-like enzyme
MSDRSAAPTSPSAHPSPADKLAARPTPCLPPGVDVTSAAEVDRYLRAGDFPFADDTHHYHFAYLDHVQRIASVKLRHGLAGYRAAPQFHRCGDGVFLLSLRAPAVDRMEYQFTLTNVDGGEETTPDPLNPFSVRDPFSTKSVAFADGYAAPIHVARPPREAVGELWETVLPGPKDRQWTTHIWSPPRAKADEQLPIVLFLDGGDYLRFASVRNIIENLQHTGRLARCRAVFVSPAERNPEYSANPETAAILSDAIPRALGELIPLPTDPAKRIAVGASLGGLCLLHAHLTAPPFFGGLLLQSGSFFQPDTDSMELRYPHFDRIATFVRTVVQETIPAPRIPIYMTCGRGGENMPNNRVMANALRAHGFPVALVEHPDAHNWTSWRDCIGEGLAHLLPA